jgi:hypothetical protein
MFQALSNWKKITKMIKYTLELDLLIRKNENLFIITEFSKLIPFK